MVKASGQIKQELASLQQKTQQMAEALDSLYEGYLTALSEAGSRQLVQAAYHLCTRAYPDKFLALSWDQRNQLQKALQAIAAKIYQQLVDQREQTKKASRQSQSHQNPNGLVFLQRLLEARGASASSSGSSAATRDIFRMRTGRDNDELLAEERYDGEYQNESELADNDSVEFGDLDREGLDREGLDREGFDEDDFEEDGFDEDDFEEVFDQGSFASIEDMRDLARDDLAGDMDEAVDEDDLDFDMEVPAADQRLTLDEEDDLLAALEGLARRSIALNSDLDGASLAGIQDNHSDSSADKSLDSASAEQCLAPMHLLKQQMLLERAIREVFKAVSEEANELLQKSNVMPQFPQALLTAAAGPRGMGEPLNAVPNVVRVSVRVMHGEVAMDSDEGDPDDDVPAAEPGRRGRSSSQASRDAERRREEVFRKSRERNRQRNGNRPSGRLGSGEEAARRMRRMMPRDVVEIEALPELSAISLRLSEVEFTDPTVSAWRSRLRQKLGDLKKLGMRYKKTQRSLETAQAEDAWRASWTARPNDSAEES